MPSAKILEAKKAQVKELAEKLKAAKMTFFVDYKGITVDEDKNLRKAYRESVKAFVTAVENNEKNVEDLFKKAVSDVDKAWSKGVLKRNTADRKKANLAKLLAK